MSTQFDVSLGYFEPVRDEIVMQQKATVDSWMQKPSALANAHLHAQNELNRLVLALNRLAWGALPDDGRAPETDEMAALMQHLSPADGEKLVRDLRLAAEQRSLVNLIRQAEAQHAAQVQAEAEELARQEAERLLIAEFEAFDAATKVERYQAWRAAKGV